LNGKRNQKEDGVLGEVVEGIKKDVSYFFLFLSNNFK
jgi:hypothetical protein